MKAQLADIIKVGKISSIDPQKGTAQVIFEDNSDKVSKDLPIIVPFSLKDKAYYMPETDERVLVLFDPSARESGYIIGSFYADTRLPPIGDENKFYYRFKDGTHIEYDKSAHKISISCEGEIEVVSKESITLSGSSQTLVL